MGGPSEERDVSLTTGDAVVHACVSLGYHTNPYPFKQNYKKLKNDLKSCDIVFNALHGGIGQNGKIQAWMDQEGISYTGSGPISSANCMDKNTCKQMAMANNVQTAKWEILDSKDQSPKLSLPFVIKPNDQGSTVGLTIVHDKSQIQKAIDEAFTHGENVMVEQYIQGRELTVTFLGDNTYPIVEIKPSHELYDYECKYTPGLSEYICPADLPKNVEHEIHQATKTMFHQLGCSVYARADFLLDDADNSYFLEMNTLPGMTSTSLVPKSVLATGMSFETLVQTIIQLSL